MANENKHLWRKEIVISNVNGRRKKKEKATQNTVKTLSTSVFKCKYLNVRNFSNSNLQTNCGIFWCLETCHLKLYERKYEFVNIQINIITKKIEKVFNFTAGQQTNKECNF